MFGLSKILRLEGITERRHARAWGKPRRIAAALAIIPAVGLIDYLTGIELRIFVLYFVPVAVLSWNASRTLGFLAAVLSGVAWTTGNYLSFNAAFTPVIWAWNIAVMQISFLFVAWLVADLRASHNRLVDLATLDGLTGVLNRRAFIEELDRELRRARRFRHPLAVVYMDLDNFKEINDLRGHAVGDEALRLVGRTLSRRVRTTDLAARLGGDEFAILLAGTDPTAARKVTEEIVANLQRAMADARLPITFSVGAACFADNLPTSADHALKLADRLMYQAKTGGKNRIVSRKAL